MKPKSPQCVGVLSVSVEGTCSPSKSLAHALIFDSPYTSFARVAWSNRFLFWSVVGGFFSVFPLICASSVSLPFAPADPALCRTDIPGLNTVVFKHTTIGWELAVPFVTVGCFIAFVEAWKLGKRVFFRRQARKNPAEGDDGLGGVFAAWKTHGVDSKDATLVV